MPYKVFKQDGGKFAVHKIDEDGKPMGKPMGMHKTHAEAMAQMKALYASENKKEAEVAIADSEGEETKEVKMMDDEIAYMPMGGACSWEEMEAHEEAQEMSEKMMDMNFKFRMMADNIIRNPMMEDKAGALVELANGYAERIKKPETEEKSLDDISRQIAGDNQPAKKEASEETKEEASSDLMIWKEGERYYCLLAYSNNRRDDDNPAEIISSESHKEFDEALHRKEWPMPELWLWHIPYRIGEVVHHAYDGSSGFPVAVAMFDKDKSNIAEAIMNSKEWTGVSHGMPDKWIQRSKEDPTIIIRHRTKEVSILPRWAAANKATFSIITKENSMATEEKGLPAHKRPDFVKLLGEEQIQQVEEVLDKTSKELDKASIEKKEAGKEPTMADVVKALEFLATQFGEVNTRLKTLEEKPVETKEAEEEWDLVSILKGKSAIGQETTKIDGRSKEAKDAPEEAKGVSPSQEIAGLPVSLIDKLVAANQQYYNGGAK